MGGYFAGFYSICRLSGYKSNFCRFHSKLSIHQWVFEVCSTGNDGGNARRAFSDKRMEESARFYLESHYLGLFRNRHYLDFLNF